MTNKYPFFAAEGGTWKTTAPNPHIELSGTALTLGTYPTQTFAAAAADATLDFDDEDTCAITIWKDADNWSRYSFAVWNDEATDTLDLSSATLEGTEGTISADDTVSVVASMPVPVVPPAGEPNGFVLTDDSTITAVAGTRTLTVAPTGAAFDYWAGGKLYSSASQNVVWTDVEGLHIFYFDKDTGLLAATTTFDSDVIFQHCIASILYWDATNDEIVLDYPVNERHGISMSPATHAYLHNAFGAQWVSGLAVSVPVVGGDGNTDSHAQFTMTTGTWRDEDLENTTPVKTNLTDTFRTIYREGATGAWRQATASSFPVVLDTSVVQYNEWTGSTWQLSNVNGSDFVLAHLFCAAAEGGPGIFVVVGQAQYPSAAAARAGAKVEMRNIDIDGLPTPELLPIATFILQYQSGNTNGAKATFEATDDGGDYIDWRSSLVGSPGSATLPAQATTAEITAGTETGLRSVSPADIVSFIDQHTDFMGGPDDILLFGIACSDETTDLETGEAAAFDVPFNLVFTRIYVSVTTAAAGANLEVDVEDEGTRLLNAVFGFQTNNAETSSFASAASSYAMTKGDLLSIDIDQVGSTTAGAGLKVFFLGYRT